MAGPFDAGGDGPGCGLDIDRQGPDLGLAQPRAAATHQGRENGQQAGGRHRRPVGADRLDLGQRAQGETQDMRLATRHQFHLAALGIGHHSVSKTSAPAEASVIAQAASPSWRPE